MEETKNELFFYFLSYFGPMSLVLFPIVKSLKKNQQKAVYEGIFLFAVYLFLAFILMILAKTPLIGLVFLIFNKVLFLLYAFLVVFVIIAKYKQMDFCIPFVSNYAERIVEKGWI